MVPPTATPEVLLAPVFPEVEATPVVLVVTATPTATPVPTQAPVYVYQTVVVTEVVSVVQPTPTLVPLAPGTVQICARVEGVSAVYVGGRGIVSGGCETFSVGVGQTTIGVQVNK